MTCQPLFALPYQLIAANHWSRDRAQLSQITAMEDKIKTLREFMSTDAGQDDVEGIRTRMSELQQASLKMFEVAYKKVRFDVVTYLWSFVASYSCVWT
jgi:CHASE3 domain sensor protein